MGALARRIGTKGVSYPAPWDGFTPTNASTMVYGSSPRSRSMNTEGALGYSPFWSGVRVLSETLAQVPLVIYRRLPGGGKERAPEHPLYDLLHTVPNPEMTSFIWRETGQSHVVTWGNHYSEKVFDSTGRLVELWPLAPDRIEKRRTDAGAVFFRYRKRTGDQTDIPARKVFHVPGLGWDGNVGYSVLAMARAALGLGMSAEQFGTTFFDQGATTSGLISTAADLDQKGADTLREKFDGRHAGVQNAHRTGVLTNGATYTQTTIPPEDAQFLETRKFQVTEMARILRLQPHMIGDLEHATFTNIEHQSLEFVKFTMLPWFTRWEQQINKDLLEGDPEYFAEFLVDGLERADASTRAAALQIRRQNGTLTADEWRQLENQNPLPDGLGEDYWRPLNMTVAGPDPVQANIAAVLIRAGFEPEAVLKALGMPAIPHLGLPPVTVQPADEPLLTAVKSLPEVSPVPAAPSNGNGAKPLLTAIKSIGDEQVRQFTATAHQFEEIHHRMDVISAREPNIHVEAPPPAQITFEAGAIQVPPSAAPVVEVHPAPPRRKTVKRDEAGRITEVVEE